VSEHDERDDYDDEPRKGRLAPISVVRRPAKFMFACGVIQLVATQVVAIMLRKNFSFYKWGDRTLQAFWQDAISGDAPTFIVLGWAGATVACIVIMVGAHDLLRFRRYGRVFAAAVLTAVSLPWIYLIVVSLPTGLVTIQLLRRRDVRARFEAVARCRVSSSERSPE
jgi:hypothetical protein